LFSALQEGTRGLRGQVSDRQKPTFLREKVKVSSVRKQQQLNRVSFIRRRLDRLQAFFEQNELPQKMVPRNNGCSDLRATTLV